MMRLGLLREQPVEAAVERHARDHRDQDRRHRRDHREQARRSAHAAAPRRGRGAAPAHTPDLARDDHDEQKDRDRVDQEQRDDDLVGRRDRREPGQHDEGHERRQQRERDGRKSRAPAASHPGAGAAAAVASSAVAAWPTSVIRSSRPKREPVTVRQQPPAWAPPDHRRYFTDAFIQQCCRIATIPGRGRPRCGHSAPSLSRTGSQRQLLLRIT